VSGLDYIQNAAVKQSVTVSYGLICNSHTTDDDDDVERYTGQENRGMK